MTLTPEIIIDDLPGLERALVDEFERRASEAIAARGRCLVAVPGGSVASAFFPSLAQSRVDWSRTEVFWTDERAVPPRDPDSNYALALALLLSPARVPPERVHRMEGELPDLDVAAAKASNELKTIAGEPPYLDLVLLGVGADGHIASIFPVSDGPDPAKRVEASDESRDSRHPLVLAVHDAPKPPPRRLTLSLPVLTNARHVVVAAIGATKAAVMHEALHRRDARLPVAVLLRRPGSSLVLLDDEAARPRA